MLVVSNTSPLRYLVEVEAVHVLPKLYSHVMTTPLVMAELCQGHFPDVVRRWAEHPPAWLQIESATLLRFQDRLDDGEASAVSLACERRASLVLIDERPGRKAARSAGIEPRGTLGILARAGADGHLDFAAALHALTTRTKFRSTPDLIADAKRQYEILCRDLLGESHGETI
jgi:predicted nucleic acid-binding protein